MDRGGAGISVALPAGLRCQSDLTADPKNTPYRDVAKLASTPAGIGTLNESAAAAIADFVVVDMFANYCTGREDLKGAMASAERQFKRIYRS
jgi:multiple sugar transport system substrate-binding protein